MPTPPAATATGTTSIQIPGAKPSKKTSYVVLELATNEGWVLRETLVASSAAAAVKASANEDAGKYVAIPSSSWKPVTVAIETKKVVTLTEAL